VCWRRGSGGGGVGCGGGGWGGVGGGGGGVGWEWGGVGGRAEVLRRGRVHVPFADRMPVGQHRRHRHGREQGWVPVSLGPLGSRGPALLDPRRVQWFAAQGWDAGRHDRPTRAVLAREMRPLLRPVAWSPTWTPAATRGEGVTQASLRGFAAKRQAPERPGRHDHRRLPATAKTTSAPRPRRHHNPFPLP